MKKYNVSTDFEAIGTVSPMIYGGFVEHAGRNVYGGIYDPVSPCADENGFRKDVLDCVRELNMPVTRYPGGSYTNTWRWEDGIGPREKRPSRLAVAWKDLEPNMFGLDEFMKWSRLAGTEPMITLNLGTRGVLEAESLWEYCNFPGGTEYSDMRIRNGSKEPYNIRYWCLGNELFGSWEVGQKTAQEYAVLARETAKMLKKHDENLKLILCGWTDNMEWNRIVLDECYPYVDLISIHEFFNNKVPLTDYLRKPDVFGRRILDTAAVCELTRHNHRKEKKIKISVDEWVVWNFDIGRHAGEEWTIAPHLLEQNYTIMDALLAGALLSTLQNNCDNVDMACIAQTVNMIAPIRTEENGKLWKQSLYDVFHLNSQYGRGEALCCRKCGDDFGSDLEPAVSVIYDPQVKTLTYFITVRSKDEVHFTASWKQTGKAEIIDCRTMHSDDPTLVNGPDSEPLHAEKLNNVTVCGTGFSAMAFTNARSLNLIRF